MDEAARRQTTKGIWMSRALDEQDHEQLVANREGGMTNNILVMDVEGTDGRERGEDQDFERKSALFALATSEVLVGCASFADWLLGYNEHYGGKTCLLAEFWAPRLIFMDK